MKTDCECKTCLLNNILQQQKSFVWQQNPGNIMVEITCVSANSVSEYYSFSTWAPKPRITKQMFVYQI